MRKNASGKITRVARSATLECFVCGQQCSGAEVMQRVLHPGRCVCGQNLQLVSEPRRKLGGKYQ